MRKCRECRSGQFQDQFKASRCFNSTMGHYSMRFSQIPCGIGSYQDEVGQAVCKPCAPGKFSPNLSASVCFNSTMGHYSMRFSQIPCGIGSYQDEVGQAVCKPCAPGKFSPNLSASVCKHCPSGFSQPIQGRSACDACNVGQFQPRSAMSNCTDCPAGQYAGNKSQHACNVCLSGYYADSAGLSKCSQCVAGTIASRNATHCELCVQGYAQSKPAQANCTACNSGQSSVTAGSSQCIGCLPGRFSPGSGNSCKDCPRQTFASSVGSSGCTACPIGSEARQYGSRECTELPPSDEHVSQIKVRAADDMGPYTFINWTQDAAVMEIQVKFRVMTASNQTENNASTTKVSNPLPGTYATSIVDLRYGLKYYFQIVASLSIAPWQTVSRVSDPILIKCPSFACCGVEVQEGCDTFTNLSFGASVAELAAQRGAFRVHEAVFEPCSKREACHGGIHSECAIAYSGMLCHRCASGYARSGTHGCSICNASSTVFIIVAMLCSILMCIYFIHTTLNSAEKTREMEMVKIALSGLQALTVIGRYPLQWPTIVTSVTVRCRG